MRDVLVSGDDARELRDALAASSAVLVREMQAAGSQGQVVLQGAIPNDQLDTLVDRLAGVPGSAVAFQPVGTIVLQPADEQLVPSFTRSVRGLSAVEVVVGGLQSIGSWTGFVTSSIASGCVVWAGFYTNLVFLLIGAMLIAPLAAPAMNGALAIASGSAYQLGRALLRFVVAIACGAVAAAALTVAFGMTSTTPLMLGVGTVSSAAIVLPVVAGVVGAMTLVQPARSNLLSGAATGILVAAALAPPVGLLGIGTVLREWDMVRSAAFQLALQYGAIGLAGSITFAVAGGVGPGSVRHGGGRVTRWVLFGATTLAVVGLLALQGSTDVSLHRTSITRDAEADARRVVEQARNVQLVDVAVTFTSEQTERGEELLLVRLVVRPDGPNGGERLDADGLERAVERRAAREVAVVADVVVVD